jgi:hypothetical protein
MMSVFVSMVSEIMDTLQKQRNRMLVSICATAQRSNLLDLCSKRQG